MREQKLELEAAERERFLPGVNVGRKGSEKNE